MPLGIDIGGSSVKVARLDPGSPSARTAHAPYAGPPDEHTVAAAIRAALQGAGPLTGLARVGLCAPGIVDPATLRVQASLNLPALVGISLPDLVHKALGEPAERPAVAVFTDARAAAHDWWCLTHRPRERLLAISLGTGVGAAVLDNGDPLIVSGGGPGHIGALHVAHDPGAPRDRDGAVGTLEAYIGLPALRARYGHELPLAAAKWSPSEPPLRALVKALKIAHAMYRPQHIALLGGVGVAIGSVPGLLQALREHTADGLTSLSREGWTLSAATSPFHAAQGAARLADVHA
jgi:glucokinase